MFWARLTASASHDSEGQSAVFIVISDISEHKLAVEELRKSELQKSEDRYRKRFVEQAPAAIAMFDRDMRYLSASRRWSIDYGLGDRNLYGLSHYEVFPDLPGCWKEILYRGLAGEVLAREEDRYEWPKGSVHWVRWEVRLGTIPQERLVESSFSLKISPLVSRPRNSSRFLRMSWNKESKNAPLNFRKHNHNICTLRSSRQSANCQPLLPMNSIIPDDAAHLNMLRIVLKSLGHVVETATDGGDAVCLAKETPCDLILMDVRMAQMDGIEALRQIKACNPAIPIIIMTAYSSVDTAVEAMKLGAYDYLTKPLNFEELKIIVERAMEHLHLTRENRSLKEKVAGEHRFAEIIGTSPAMKSVMDMARIVAPTEATVLITGESGTGKELFARAIHANSERKNGPLVTVNCAALTETLLESELFGHEKGTFTGADRQRDGRFVQAANGTIFLDEVGEIPLAMQAKILRAIQERGVQRLGSDKVLHVDVRIIAATNRDLQEEVKAGRFREDLYYRLNVMNLHIPPLRERADDIPLLAQHFLRKYVRKNRKDLKGFTPRPWMCCPKAPGRGISGN